MNFSALFKAYDTFNTLREAARRYKAATPGSSTPDTGLSQTAASGLAGQVEARLTGVVVAALKEAFDRDHARLELERAHIEEERRRAEEALRLELRRQAIDREVGRLRLLAGAAVVGWISSIAMFAMRAASTSTGARALIAAGWLLLLGALCLTYYLKLLIKKPALNLRQSPSFWIITGLFFYSLAITPFFMIITTDFIIDHAKIYHILFALHHISFSFLFIAIIKAFLCKKPLTT